MSARRSREIGGKATYSKIFNTMLHSEHIQQMIDEQRK